MRLIIKVSKSKEIIDFNYQNLLTGCVHKWLGKNNLQHGGISLYSFSWLQNVDIVPKKGIKVKEGSYFILNFYKTDLIKTVVQSILDSPEMFFGIRVVDVTIKPVPQFSNKEHFLLASPVFIKRRDEKNGKSFHYTYLDKESEEYLTETLKRKADEAHLNTEGLRVYFDTSYHSPQTKIISYKNIKNKVSLCPVIVEGTPEVVAFAWEVGVGNSTGIGFGALK